MPSVAFNMLQDRLAGYIDTTGSDGQLWPSLSQYVHSNGKVLGRLIWSCQSHFGHSQYKLYRNINVCVLLIVITMQKVYLGVVSGDLFVTIISIFISQTVVVALQKPTGFSFTSNSIYVASFPSNTTIVAAEFVRN